MAESRTVLAIDIGNSSTKVGCFVDGNLEGTEVFPTDRDNSSPLGEELTDSLIALEGLEGIVVSSVVPSAQQALSALLANTGLADRLFWVQRETIRQVNLGTVDISRYGAGELGTDRIADIVSAVTHYPDQNVLVCDFGTTSTFDLVDSKGVYLGGAISPGPRKFQSLMDSAHAAQLFEVDVFRKPGETPGLSTRTSLENGLYYGYKGIILEVVGNLLQDAHWPFSLTTVVMTGGFAHPIRDMLTLEFPAVHIDSGLTLKGLYALWTLNCKDRALL